MPGIAGILAPAAEILVQIKGCSAVPEFDVGQPLGDDVEKGCIQSYSCSDKCDNDPRLACVVRISEFPSPA